MTISEFQQVQSTLECKYCSVVGRAYLGSGSEQASHGVRCSACGKFLFWCAKEHNHSKNPIHKRPRLKRGTIDEVWEEFGNRCLHCGVHGIVVEALGLKREVQHVPPYHIQGHEAWLYPYCSRCNSDAETRWKHMETVAKRLGLLDYFHAEEKDVA